LERTYHFPWPISQNAIWRAVKGRNILSSAARRWFAEASELLSLQPFKAFKGPVELSVKLCPPNKRKWDIDNKSKVLLDALVKKGIIEGDDWTIVKKLTLEINEESEPGNAFVTVRSNSSEGGA
jgi:crossover junction endodeoxyribonuclease RusA